MRRRLVASAICALLLLQGCADGPPSGASGQPAAAPGATPDTATPSEPDSVEHGVSEMSSDHMDMDHEAHEETFAFGEPGDPAAADRTIDVTTAEEGGFHYEPETITVDAGETVTFHVRNVGEAVHEFVLGDEAVQQAHEAEMRAMASEDGSMMHDDPNALSLQPGETKELTWRFTTPGTLQYGCHEPGHYAAGMRGDLTVRD